MQVQSLANNFYDYTPVVSTAVGAYTLFEKIVVIPRMSPADVASQPSYKKLDDTSFTRCTFMLLPVIGNIFLAIFDLFVALSTNSIIAQIEEGEEPRPILNSSSLLLRAISLKGPEAFEWATADLQEDDEAVKACLKLDGRVLKYTKSGYSSKIEYILIALGSHPECYTSLSETMKTNQEVCLCLARVNPTMLIDQAFENGDILKAAIEHCELKNMLDEVVHILGKNGLGLQYLRIKREKHVIAAAQQNPEALLFAPEFKKSAAVALVLAELHPDFVLNKMDQAVLKDLSVIEAIASSPNKPEDTKRLLLAANSWNFDESDLFTDKDIEGMPQLVGSCQIALIRLYFGISLEGMELDTVLKDDTVKQKYDAVQAAKGPSTPSKLWNAGIALAGSVSRSPVGKTARALFVGDDEVESDVEDRV